MMKAGDKEDSYGEDSYRKYLDDGGEGDVDALHNKGRKPEARSPTLEEHRKSSTSHEEKPRVPQRQKHFSVFRSRVDRATVGTRHRTCRGISNSSSDNDLETLTYPASREERVPSADGVVANYLYGGHYQPHQLPRHPPVMCPPYTMHGYGTFDHYGCSGDNTVAAGAYSFLPPPPPPGFPLFQWTPVTPVEYIANIKREDVLSGRGGATNSHSGNREFRSLVKKFQDRYLRAKKRDKPAVASLIVEEIRNRGGRFLRRIDTTPQGQVLWVDIGDDRAREKTCQALREGAPEIRRRRKGDEDSRKKLEFKATATGLSASSSVDRSAGSNDEDAEDPADWGSRSEARRSGVSKEQSIMIRPSTRLLQMPFIEAIPIDQLGPQERELYLRDFLPPDPAIRRNYGREHSIEPTSHSAEGESEGGDDWRIVKV